MYSNACSAVGFGAVFLFAEDAELFLADVFFVLDLAAEVFFVGIKNIHLRKTIHQ